jgi:valyl-tRNA synthetase
VVEASSAYTKLRLNEAASAVYRFLWSDLADWYLELIKPRLYGDQPGGDVARSVLLRTFQVALQLLHPVMPFITEALWQRLPGRREEDYIVRSPWPRSDARAVDPEALRDFGLVQELVTAVRAIRAEHGVEPGKTIRLRLSRPTAWIDAELRTISRLTKASAITFGPSGEEPGAHAVVADGTSVFVALGDLIDVSRECTRLGEEVDRLRQLIEGQHRKLANQQFTDRAPPEVVARERAKLATWQTQVAALEEKRELLGCP